MVDRFFSDAYLAAVYDCWHKRAVRDDFDFYLPRVMKARAVLDVGCGTGMMLAEARDAGHDGRLCGLDPGGGMLALARRRTDVEWVENDLAGAGFERAFDLAVMTGHAFQAIVGDDEIDAALAALRRALVPGGCFAFETRNPAARAWENWHPGNAVTIEGPSGAPVRIETRLLRDFDGSTVSFRHDFTGEDEALPLSSESTLRFLDVEALMACLARAGFSVAEIYGDWDGSPFGSSSPEIIVIAMSPAD